MRAGAGMVAHSRRVTEAILSGAAANRSQALRQASITAAAPANTRLAPQSPSRYSRGGGELVEGLGPVGPAVSTRAPSMSARWEIDLSPGTAVSPPRAAAGLRMGSVLFVERSLN